MLKLAHLGRTYTRGGNREARWNLLLGSAEGAMAMTNGLGSADAMSRAVSGVQKLDLRRGTAAPREMRTAAA